MAQKPSNWVKKAVAKKSSYSPRSMRKTFEADGVLMATDGRRAHYHFDDSYVCANNSDDDFPHDVLIARLEDARGGDLVATFSPYAVRKACTAALVFFKRLKNTYVPPFIYCYFGKTLMKLGTARDEIGSMEFRLRDGDKWKLVKSTRDQHYDLLCQDRHHVYFNPLLLRDTLDGMGESATMRFSPENFHYHFEGDNKSEAILMPLSPATFVQQYKPVFNDFSYE